jgi:hypothetical protein
MLGASIVLAGVAILACALPAAAHPVSDAPPTGQPVPVTESVTVVRPAGRILITDVSLDDEGHLELTVTDTRNQDPGWTVLVTATDTHGPVRWTPHVASKTPSFTDSSGTRYQQRVAPGDTLLLGAGRRAGAGTLASAPAHHGLGIARLSADLSRAHGPAKPPKHVVVTITVV